jgi:hypothetical protein
VVLVSIQIRASEAGVRIWGSYSNDGVVKRSPDVNTVEATDQVYVHYSEVCGHVNSNKDLLVVE